MKQANTNKQMHKKSSDHTEHKINSSRNSQWPISKPNLATERTQPEHWCGFLTSNLNKTT